MSLGHTVSYYKVLLCVSGTHTVPHTECYDAVNNEWYDATDMNINRSALKACIIRDLPNITDFTHYGHSKDMGGDKEQKTDNNKT